MTDIKAHWEQVFVNGDVQHRSESTYRMQVPGGWLYRHVHYVKKGNEPVVVETMAFVPTPNSK